MMRKPRLGELFKARGPMMMKMMVVIREPLKATVSDLVMGIGALLEKHRFLRYPGYDHDRK